MWNLFERILVAPWSRHGRIIGCSGAILGGLVFQKHGKNFYKTHIFNFASFCCLSYMGALLEAMLAHLGEFWTPKWAPKINKDWFQKWFSLLVVFSISFGIILGLLRKPKSAQKGNQKWDHCWNLQALYLRG